MANNIIDISLACPVRFVETGSHPGFDNDWYENLLYSFQDDVPYFQKWKATDIIKLQFYSTFTPIQVAIINCQGTVNTYNATKKTTSYTDDEFDVYEVSVPLTGLSGVYYLKLSVGTTTNLTEMVSEPLYIADHEDTILLTYSSEENVQGVIFETGIEFTFRVEGAILNLLPGFKDTIYQDQILNNVLLSSVPFRQFKLKIGAVPDWAIDKINRILSMNWSIDGKSFVKKDGSEWAAVSVDNYPLSGWSIDILEANNLSSKRATNSGDPTQQIAVVYNIKTDLFGPLSVPDSPTIQITEISNS